MLIPCIDLQDGQAVQLVHGRRRELAVADVFGLLERFKKYPWLHVIDLDAAMRKGENNKLVEELCRRAKTDYGMKVRVGGGIRTTARAKRLVKLGAEQVILGSAVFVAGEINLKLLRELKKAVSQRRVVIALDTWRGKITVRDCAGHVARENYGAGVEEIAGACAARGHGGAGAALCGVSLHGCGSRRDDDRRESEMVSIFAGGDGTSDHCGGRD